MKNQDIINNLKISDGLSSKLLIIDDFNGEYEINVKKIDLKKMTELQYEIVNILIDEENKIYHAFLYDFIINTRILKYFADIDFNDNLQEFYNFLNSDTGVKLIQNIKEDVFLKRQIDEVYSGVDRYIKHKLDIMKFTNLELNEMLFNINHLLSMINTIADKNIKHIDSELVNTFISNIANLSNIDQNMLVDKILEHNKDITAVKKTRKKNADNILEFKK